MFACRINEDIELRLLETRHAEEFYGVVQRNLERLKVWCPWLDRVASAEMTRDFLREKVDRFAAGNGFTAGIFHLGSLSGVIALEHIDVQNRATEIGYWIDSHLERRGLVTAACRAVITYAFTQLGLERVQIRCAVENARSRAIPEKLGFKFEGVLRQCERLPLRTVDLAVYGLLATEWKSPG